MPSQALLSPGSPPGSLPSSFFLTALRSNRRLLCQIYSHSFNRQLFKGTLPLPVFGRFLRDDYFYLRHFASRLLQLSDSTLELDPTLAGLLRGLGEDLVSGELQMQEQYMEHLQNHDRPGPAISGYVAFLKECVCQQALPVALSAVLPCFWIYANLGARHSPPLQDHPYKAWIDTYSAASFVAATEQLAQAVDLLGQRASRPTLKQMGRAFRTATRFELEFLREVL